MSTVTRDAPLATAAWTGAAMLAFAANSLLCRLALGQGLIDPLSFATVRVATAAATLAPFVWPRWRARGRTGGDWRSAAVLFAYLICFSIAYLSVAAGTGALILFGAAQVTMIGAALRDGDAFPVAARGGLVVAIFGLIYLVSPGSRGECIPCSAGATRTPWTPTRTTSYTSCR